jgi:hypothetical protein
MGIVFGKTPRSECPICYEPMHACGPIVVPCCKQTFHNRCLMRWAVTKPSCPLCRGDISACTSSTHAKSEAVREWSFTVLYMIFNIVTQIVYVTLGLMGGFTSMKVCELPCIVIAAIAVPLVLRKAYLAHQLTISRLERIISRLDCIISRLDSLE